MYKLYLIMTSFFDFLLKLNFMVYIYHLLDIFLIKYVIYFLLKNLNIRIFFLIILTCIKIYHNFFILILWSKLENILITCRTI